MPRTFKDLFGSSLLFGSLCVAFASGSAQAATYRWVGPNNGTWNTPSNWSLRAVPGASDSVVIDAKKTVSVNQNVTVANLSVGVGAQVKSGASIKVTKSTNSRGTFIGSGTLVVPAGATAIYDLRATKGTLAKSTIAPTVFAPITNRGTIITKVAPGCGARFASITNAEGATLSIDASGAPTARKAEPGFTLAGLSLFDNVGDIVDSVIYFDHLTNRKGGTVKLSGSKLGRYFDGDSIYNEGNLQLNGAQMLLADDITNTAGATLTLDSDATVLPTDGTAPRLNNAGKIIKTAGSDATLSVNWNNNGQVVVENGTLHVRVPLGQVCKQMGGTTTLEGGILSIEGPMGTDENATFEVAGGDLDGIGTIQGNVLNSGGHIRPGHSPGSITINGNFTQTSGGVLDMEIGGTDAGTTYDQILVNGTAYLDGTLNWVRWGGFVPSNGDVYTLFTYYSKVGNFAQFVDTAPVSGLTYDTTLTPTDYEVNCYSTGTNPTGPPTAAITNPLNGKALTSITSATGTASANGSSAVTGVTCLLYRYTNPVTGAAAGFWNGGTTWTSTASAANEEPASGTTNWTFAFPTLVPGRYSLRATATNASGVTAASATSAFWVDPNAPTVLTIDAPVGGSSLSSLTTINGTTSDASDGSGVVSVQGRIKRNADNLYWNGSGWYAPVYSFSTTLSGTKWARTTSLPSGTNLKLGTYTITAIATDRAGNAKTVTSTFTVVASGGGA